MQSPYLFGKVVDLPLQFCLITSTINEEKLLNCPFVLFFFEIPSCHKKRNYPQFKIADDEDLKNKEKKFRKQKRWEQEGEAFGFAGLCWATDEYRGGGGSTHRHSKTLPRIDDGGVVDVAQSPSIFPPLSCTHTHTL